MHALKEYQGMSGYYRKLFFVPIVHSIAPTSPNIEAIIIESYFANHPFLYVFYDFYTVMCVRLYIRHVSGPMLRNKYA